MCGTGPNAQMNPRQNGQGQGLKGCRCTSSCAQLTQIMWPHGHMSTWFPVSKHTPQVSSSSSPAVLPAGAQLQEESAWSTWRAAAMIRWDRVVEATLSAGEIWTRSVRRVEEDEGVMLPWTATAWAACAAKAEGTPQKEAEGGERLWGEEPWISGSGCGASGAGASGLLTAMAIAAALLDSGSSSCSSLSGLPLAHMDSISVASAWALWPMGSALLAVLPSTRSGRSDDEDGRSLNGPPEDRGSLVFLGVLSIEPTQLTRGDELTVPLVSLFCGRTHKQIYKGHASGPGTRQARSIVLPMPT
jgi:hypothetical protein